MHKLGTLVVIEFNNCNWNLDGINRFAAYINY